MDYMVKNVKTFMGHDGDPSGGMECTLYLGKKRLGTVVDDSWGGGLQFHIDDNDMEKLNAFCKTLPKWGSEFGEGEYDTDADIFVDGLVKDFLTAKTMKRKCKGKTLWKTKDQKDGAYWELKIKFTEKIKSDLLAKYPNIDFFYNEKYNVS